MARTDLTKLSWRDLIALKLVDRTGNTLQEVADYMQPRKADVTKTRSKGDKRTEQIFDSSNTSCRIVSCVFTWDVD